MSDRIVRSIPLVLVSTAVWVLLHAELNVVNVLWGVVISVLLVLCFPVDRTARRHRLHVWALAKYVVFMLWNLVLSSLAVIRAVLRPTPSNLAAGIVRIELTGDSPLTTTLVANSITLTPGTMTLTAEVAPTVLHVHGLGLGDLDEFRASVLDLERRVIAAVEPVPSSPVPSSPVPSSPVPSSPVPSSEETPP